MKSLIILIFFFSISANINAQKVDFQGRIINPFQDYEVRYRIVALSLTDSTQYEWTTDSLGHFHSTNILCGTYQFYISHKMNDGLLIDSILIDSSSNNWEATIPECTTVNENGICEYCNHKQYVFKLNPYLIRDIWFKSKRDEKKYYRKQNKKGYDISDDQLIWIKDEELKTKLYDPCYHWFCEKHIHIF